MPLVIGPLDGLRLEMHVGHVLGLKHDLGIGVDPSYKPCWDHITMSLGELRIETLASTVRLKTKL